MDAAKKFQKELNMRAKKSHGKDEGHGGLQLMITDENYICVGDVKIYLSYIQQSGADGGNRQVKLRFLGPKEIPITRHEIEK